MVEFMRWMSLKCIISICIELGYSFQKVNCVDGVRGIGIDVIGKYLYECCCIWWFYILVLFRFRFIFIKF